MPRNQQPLGRALEGGCCSVTILQYPLSTPQGAVAAEDGSLSPGESHCQVTGRPYMETCTKADHWAPRGSLHFISILCYVLCVVFRLMSHSHSWGQFCPHLHLRQDQD